MKLNTCMSTKLTLTLRKEIIEQAKKYASSKGSSLSEMVENYFTYLTQIEVEDDDKLTERVSRLRGIVKVDPDFDYKTTLDDEKAKKHGI